MGLFGGLYAVEDDDFICTSQAKQRVSCIASGDFSPARGLKSSSGVFTLIAQSYKQPSLQCPQIGHSQHPPLHITHQTEPTQNDTLRCGLDHDAKDSSGECPDAVVTDVGYGEVEI